MGQVSGTRCTSRWFNGVQQISYDDSAKAAHYRGRPWVQNYDATAGMGRLRNLPPTAQSAAFHVASQYEPRGFAGYAQLEATLVHLGARAFTDSSINLSYASQSVLSCILNCIAKWRRDARARP